MLKRFESHARKRVHILFGKPEFHVLFDMRQQLVQGASLIAIELHYLRNRYCSISVGVEPLERIPDSIIRLKSLRDLVGGVGAVGTQRTDYSGNSRIDGREHLPLPVFGLRVRLPNNRGVSLFDPAISAAAYAGF